MKIKLTNAPKPTRMLDIIEGKGLELLRSDDGRVMVRVPFPGVKAVELDQTAIKGIVQTLNKTVPMGDRPEEVFARSASIDAEGNLTARFQDKERARSVEFTVQDREDMIGFLDSVLDSWTEYSQALFDAESQSEKTEE